MPPVDATPTPEHVSLDLWVANLEAPVFDLASWLGRIELRLADAAARGVSALIMPEFTCAQWLSFAPLDMPAKAGLGWLAETGTVALPAMAALSARYGVSLMPGTIPHSAGRKNGVPTFTNRAWLLTPQGEAHYQDKLSLTPAETDGAEGVTVRGGQVRVFEWMGFKVAIVICLDVEFTELSTRLGKLDLDLVLVPAKTDMITGYHRVFGCARARAIELQTAVCVVGAVGVPMGHPETDTGVGGAAAYLPCDVSVSLDGIFAQTPPQAAVAGTSPVLSVHNLPVGQCRRIRNGSAEAEVAPASWDARHLKIVGP
jgi:predicted amidohydrolase